MYIPIARIPDGQRTILPKSLKAYAEFHSTKGLQAIPCNNGVLDPIPEKKKQGYTLFQSSEVLLAIPE